jgi:aspartate-semialdehyde dehydrogenase
MTTKKIRVAILGATGTVGQRMIQLLDGHPWFDVSAVAASDGSRGKRYHEAAHWLLETPVPREVRDLEVQACSPGLDADVVLSTLPSPVALEVEADFARSGYPVISNASSYRMAEEVPLLVPEINAPHVDAIARQKAKWGGRGFIVTNPNCSTIGLVFPLAALERAFGLEAVHVVTMQALSGAGYPGVASLDALDNVVPSIGGGDEERKIETEPLKILGSWNGDSFEPARFRVSAMTHRVSVRDGHLEACSVKLTRKASAEDVRASMANFTSEIDPLELPSAPRPVMLLEDDVTRPQPRLDRDRAGGMAVVVGPILPCGVLDYKFRILSHNTVRGAAGAAILNAELLLRRGLIG